MIIQSCMVYIKNDQQFQVIVKKGLQKALLAFQNKKAFWQRTTSFVRKKGKAYSWLLVDLPISRIWYSSLYSDQNFRSSTVMIPRESMPVLSLLRPIRNSLKRGFLVIAILQINVMVRYERNCKTCRIDPLPNEKKAMKKKHQNIEDYQNMIKNYLCSGVVDSLTRSPLMYNFSPFSLVQDTITWYHLSSSALSYLTFQ